MRIDELLNELDEIVKTASSVPLTGKVMVEAAEIKEIIDEIDRVSVSYTHLTLPTTSRV